MMMSDSGEPRQMAMRPPHHGVITGLPPPTNTNGEQQQEKLPCPRCDSTNTKFCYYNNYNFSQPRHFCKSCRRYWTHGGTLRDVPVGGGTRKAAKRSRTCSSSVVSASSAGTSSSPLQATPVLFPPSSSFNGLNHTVTAPLDNGGKGSALSLSGSFTSLLTHHNNAAHGTGSVIGFGIGSGFDDVSFGLGRAVWPFSTAGDSATTNVAIPSTWQFEGLESSNAGEYFGWPDLSIAAPENSQMKRLFS